MSEQGAQGSAIPWIKKLSAQAALLAGLVGGLSAFFADIGAIKTNLKSLLGLNNTDNGISIHNVQANAFIKTTFVDVLADTKDDIKTLPFDNKYYNISFFLKKDGSAGLKECRVVVDGDPFKPIVKGAVIGDVPSNTHLLRVEFSIKMLAGEPKQRTIYVQCEDTVSEAVAVTLG